MRDDSSVIRALATYLLAERDAKSATIWYDASLQASSEDTISAMHERMRLAQCRFAEAETRLRAVLSETKGGTADAKKT